MQTNKAANVLGRLLWPDRVPARQAERDEAIAVIERANVEKRLTDEQACWQRAHAERATTRGEIREALGGLPGVVAPKRLVTTLRIATVASLGLSAVNAVIWALICLFSTDLEKPWWLFCVVIGGAIVGALWWVTESYHSAARLSTNDSKQEHKQLQSL